MPKIDESEVQKLRDEIKRLEKRLNERDEQFERESVWAIHSEKRDRFYTILSICGIAVSVVTLFAEWNGWNPSALLTVFNEIGIGIFSSVVIVWFSFQSGEAFMGWRDAVREGIHERGIQKGKEEGRREERERWVESLRNQGVSDDVISERRKRHSFLVIACSPASPNWMGSLRSSLCSQSPETRPISTNSD